MSSHNEFEHLVIVDEPPIKPTPSKRPSISNVTSAPELAGQSRFATWADEVKLDTVIYEEIPEDLPRLKTLQDVMLKIPSWILSSDSPQFSHLKHRHGEQVDSLVESLSSDIINNTTINGDPDDDLASALGVILQATSHLEAMTRGDAFNLHPTEHDRRFPIDNIMAAIYDHEERLFHYTERTIKLPKTSATGLADAKTDGAAFIFVPNSNRFSSSLPGSAHSYSCIAGSEPPLELLLLHFVIGYKRNKIGKNQTLMGLVAALYQRRSLGCEGHFVFGAIYHGQVRFQVVAATWKNGMIRVYALGGFDTRLPWKMIQFYLLVRATNEFARRYGAEIKEMDNMPLPIFNNFWSLEKKLSVAPSSTMSSSSRQSELSGDADGQSEDAEDSDDGEDRVNEEETTGKDSELATALRSFSEVNYHLKVSAYLALNQVLLADQDTPANIEIEP